MCDVLVWFLDAISRPETVSAIASVVTAAIACYALQIWKKQDKAKREADFLDALIEAAHIYNVELSKPIMLLRMAKVGLPSNEAVVKILFSDQS